MVPSPWNFGWCLVIIHFQCTLPWIANIILEVYDNNCPRPFSLCVLMELIHDFLVSDTSGPEAYASVSPHFPVKLIAIIENQSLASILPRLHSEEEAIQVLALKDIWSCQISSHWWFILWNPCSDPIGSNPRAADCLIYDCSNNEENWPRMQCPHQETEKKGCRACPEPQLHIRWWTSLLCQSCSKRYAWLYGLRPLAIWLFESLVLGFSRI